MEGKDSNQGKSGAKQGGDRDKVKAEREARRLAKVAAKQKTQDKGRNLPDTSPPESNNPTKPIESAAPPVAKTVPSAASKKDAKIENAKPKKQPNSQTKANKPSAKPEEVAVVEKLEQLNISNKSVELTPAAVDADDKTKKVLTKAERRAIQEAQRAAKAGKTATTTKTGASAPAAAGNKKVTLTPKPVAVKSAPAGSKEKLLRKSPTKAIPIHRVKLFNHLYVDKKDSRQNIVNSATIHPAIIRLGVQYETGVVKGSNARCIAFLNAIKLVNISPNSFFIIIYQ